MVRALDGVDRSNGRSVTIWIVPAAVFGAALVPLVAVVLRLAAEVSGVQAELARLSEFRPAVAELRRESDVARARLARLRRR